MHGLMHAQMWEKEAVLPDCYRIRKIRGRGAWKVRVLEAKSWDTAVQGVRWKAFGCHSSPRRFQMVSLQEQTMICYSKVQLPKQIFI